LRAATFNVAWSYQQQAKVILYIMNESYIDRKNAIELRLKNNGINDIDIKYLPYLDFDPDLFASPFDVGCRIMILLALSYVVNNESLLTKIIEWLKREKIWEYVSPKEQLLFEGKVTDKRSLISFSWQIESAYVLAWTLGLVTELSEDCEPMNDSEFDEFNKNIPPIGDNLSGFLSNLKYINKSKIIDENLFNELVTTHLRDSYFSGKSSTSNINPTVSLERHKSLNWLRRFTGIEEWDETDTST